MNTDVLLLLGYAAKRKLARLFEPEGLGQANHPSTPIGTRGPDDALRRRTIPLSWDRCALADSCGIDQHGHWKLLDVADEPQHQLVAGRLAALRGDWQAVDDLRPA